MRVTELAIGIALRQDPCRIPSGAVNYEPESLYDNSQRDLWSGSVIPCAADFLWLAGRNRRLDGADVAKLDRSRRHRRLELLRNKPRHAWLTQRKQTALHRSRRAGIFSDALRLILLAYSVGEDTKSGINHKLAFSIYNELERKIRPALGAENPPCPWRTTLKEALQLLRRSLFIKRGISKYPTRYCEASFEVSKRSIF
jgi:hypothetical protein